MSEEQEKYRPSNGTEGEGFIGKWCANCRAESFDLDDDLHCEILGNTMIYADDDPKYPCEWIIDKSGPRCTAFDDIKTEPGKARCPNTIDLFQGTNNETF